MRASPVAIISTLFVLCRYVTTTALPSNVSSTDLELGNTHSLAAIPDLPGDDFSFRIEWRTPRISEISSIMACIWAMRELALQDFESGTISQGGWVHPRFPGVLLAVVPPAGKDRLTVRFAMWVITATLRVIVEARLNKTIALTGDYKGRTIGTAKLTEAPPDDSMPLDTVGYNGSQLAFEKPSQKRFSFPLSNASSHSGVELGSGDQLHATINFLDTAIDRYDIFFSVAWFMLACAKDNHKWLAFLNMMAEAPRSRITSSWNAVRQAQTRMSFGDLISFLAYLPEYCVQQETFREMDATISDDNAPVARGSIRARPIRNAAATLSEAFANSNISVS
ncbi:hypothetical protein ACLMJK_005633 [Lecanora helva]